MLALCNVEYLLNHTHNDQFLISKTDSFHTTMTNFSQNLEIYILVLQFVHITCAHAVDIQPQLISFLQFLISDSIRLVRYHLPTDTAPFDSRKSQITIVCFLCFLSSPPIQKYILARYHCSTARSIIIMIY